MEDNREETGSEGMGMDLIKTCYSMHETTRIINIKILVVYLIMTFNILHMIALNYKTLSFYSILATNF